MRDLGRLELTVSRGLFGCLCRQVYRKVTSCDILLNNRGMAVEEVNASAKHVVHLEPRVFPTWWNCGTTLGCMVGFLTTLLALLMAV